MIIESWVFFPCISHPKQSVPNSWSMMNYTWLVRSWWLPHKIMHTCHVILLVSVFSEQFKWTSYNEKAKKKKRKEKQNKFSLSPCDLLTLPSPPLFSCPTEPMLSALLRRMPGLDSCEIHQLVNCPESFTPDMRCLMGETPGVHGYYVLAGMNSSGLSFAGGAGK